MNEIDTYNMKCTWPTGILPNANYIPFAGVGGCAKSWGLALSQGGFALGQGGIALGLQGNLDTNMLVLSKAMQSHWGS